MIEEYKFGSITINGKIYNHDIELRWTDAADTKGARSAPETGQEPRPSEQEVLKWWRKEGHSIGVEDIKRAIEQNPDIIIIGTGESGTAEVTEAAKNEIKSKGIELIIDLTEQATKTFNVINEESEEEEGEQKKVIGLFHLTC